MRTTCRLILGVAVFAAVAGLASAQQPDPQPPPPPLPEMQVTPVPPPPEAVPVPPAEQQTTATAPAPTAPDMVVAAPVKPVKKSPPAKKPAQAMASKKAIEKPVAPEVSSQSKEGAAAAAASVADQPSPPPPGGTASVAAGTASPDLSQVPPPAADPLQAEMDQKRADAAQRKTTASGWILIGVGVALLAGLVVFFVRTRSGVSKLPSIFDGASAPQHRSPLVSGRRL